MKFRPIWRCHHINLLGWALGNGLDVSGIDWSDWSGLHLNIVVASASIVLAFPAGLLLALGRRSSLPVKGLKRRRERVAAAAGAHDDVDLRA